MNHLSLFTGIGGIDLAAEWAGFTTVGQCEWADYPTKVLEKHWPDVPRWKDIHTLTKESFYDKTGRTTVDLISGGFPCQPFSVAGKRGGDSDDRFLWPEMLRVIQELRPSWVLGENVAGIVSMALDQVLSDLENLRYEVQAFIIPACAVDAQHRRDRCFILAYSEHERQPHGEHEERPRCESRISEGLCADVADTEGIRQQGERSGGEQVASLHGRSVISLCDSGHSGEWPVEPDVGRVAHGVPSRVDRLKCLGNAVLPQQVYPILRAIADIEEAKQ